MAVRSSRRECYFFHNHLTGIVKKIENYYTTIDLRNESCVTGKIVHVDGYMNIDLEDAIFYDVRGTEIPFQSFFIRARNIRYVHIPLELSITDLMQSIGQKVRRPKIKTKRSFKTKRAQRRQQELLVELAANSQQK